MRLANHLAGASSPKSASLRATVKAQFRANRHVTDPAAIHALKQSAERGLSNYLLFQRAKQDPKIAAHAAKMDQFQDDEHGNLVAVSRTSPAPAKRR